MKIYINFPFGKISLEWEPMSQERFNAICLLIGIFIVGSGVLKFFALMVGA